jgi:hypothetical protein
MPLVLSTSNFANWTKFSSNYYYPKNNDSNNHIHVACTEISEKTGKATIKSVSIKINGKSTNLRPMSAAKGFKFDPKEATFPTDPVETEYKNALRDAGLIE